MYTSAKKEGGLAVVTGAASGVGRAAALRFAQDGFGVVLADLASEQLDDATKEIREVSSAGVDVFSVATDVSKNKDVQALADAAFAAGPVAVLMNNAGVSIPTGSWDNLQNWQKMLDVNLFGVLRGIHAFTPRMIEADRPAVIVNTGSKQGITTPPGNPGYNVSKAGVRTASEQLAHDLRKAEAPISVHLFVPGFTYTGMIARHIPEKPSAAWSSEQTVGYFMDRMSEGDFYILVPDGMVTPEIDKRRVAWASGDLTENRPALSRWHPEFAAQFEEFEKGGK